jgi:hypothetical protein
MEHWTVILLVISLPTLLVVLGLHKIGKQLEQALMRWCEQGEERKHASLEKEKLEIALLRMRLEMLEEEEKY